jgi:hypothetical protein
MKRLNREKILSNRYTHLLIAEIAIVASFPFLRALQPRFPIVSLILLLAIMSALRVVLPKKAFMPLMALGALGFLLEIIVRYNKFPQAENVPLYVLILYAIFLTLAIVILIKKMMITKVITADTIKGGISIYFLIGLLWTMFYIIASSINPNSIGTLENRTIDFFYYSYTTLTTLGYGDITPTGDTVKLLAISEAFIGQIYLAIFIAQLVGLSIAQKLLKNQD